MKTAQNLVNQSSSALSVVLKNSFGRSCMDRRKNWLFWGLKVTPWLFGFVAPPLFFPFHFSGNIFCKQTSSDNGISLKKVQMGCGTRFSLKFSNQVFVFSHIFLWPVGVLFEWSPTPPPPPQVVSQQHYLWTLKLWISQLIQGVAGLESQ